jgi:FemAB-related protein (PEP-CTERM system-associated)
MAREPHPAGVQVRDGVGDGPTWDAYVSAHPSGSPFHTAAWQRMLDRTLPYVCHSAAATRDERIVGVLPLYRVRTLPFGSALVSTPLAVYGGILADDAAAEGALLRHAQALSGALGVRYLELRNQTAIEGLLTKDRYVTFRKEIDADPEKNMAAIPRNQRRSIRQGYKFGLTSSVGGVELLPGFYRIYVQSQRNLGTPVLPLALFRNLFQELGPAIRILAVYREGAMISGVMTIFYRDQVLPYYGGAVRDAFRYGVNDFMYWSLLCHAAERGARIFDFGRSKVDSGSYHFKRHWGFEPTPLPYQYHLVRQRELPDLSPMNPRFALAIRVWKRMPLWLARQLGPRLVRFFP